MWKEFRNNVIEIRFNRLNLHFLLLLKIRYLPQPHYNRYDFKSVEDFNTGWLESQRSFYRYLRDRCVESREKVSELESFEVLNG